MAEGAEKYLDLGYSVAPADQSLISGPGAGGLICMHRTLDRWFPAVLFRTEASFEPVPGFSKASLFPLHFLIGKITAEHKLGLAPYPQAPSPIFSLERVETRPELLCVGIASIMEKSFAVLLDRMRFWNERILASSEAPAECHERFDAIKRRNFRYLWCTVPVSECDLLLEIAKYVHACSFVDQQGASLASHIHLFVSLSADLNGEFSAAKWPVRMRTRRTSNDW